MSVRLIVIGAIVLVHACIFYGVIHTRARPMEIDSRQAFTPVERATGGSSGSLTGAGRPKDPEPPRADRRWRFDPVEVLPVGPAQDTLINARFAAAKPQDADSLSETPENERLTIQSGLPPEYPLEAARAGREGSVVLDVHLDAEGKPTEIKVLSATAPAALVESAQRAVNAWRFSMPGKVSAWAELELRFSAYRYGYSFVSEPVDGTPDPGKEPVSSQESFRGVLGELSSSRAMFATFENSQPAFQKMRATVIKWGKPLQVRLLNPKEKEWKEYGTKPEFRGATYGGTVALRWDRYEVRHENLRARWKVAVDPFGRIWAVKADTF